MNKRKSTKTTKRNTQSVKARWTNWTNMHKSAFNNAIQRLSLTPMTTFLTMLVVGIALSLPASFQIVVKNLESGQQSIDEQSRISLYLTKNTPEADIKSLIHEIKLNDGVRDTLYISAEQGLQDFQKHNAFSILMSDNPLPAVIHVFPNTLKLDPDQIESLSKDLAEFILVEKAQIDVLWLKRLFSITQFVKQITLAISLFLIFSVLIVIGNTIKLLGKDFHDEITVSKLVGATDAYVRLPFLYSGLLYGASGSLIAISFVLLGILWVTPKINQLSELYQSEIFILGLGFSDIFSILGIGMTLGLGGAWIAANRLIHSLSI